MEEERSIIYVVKVGYNKFIFEQAEDAISFAETAKTHYAKVDNYDEKDLTVEVTLHINNNSDKEEE